MVPLSPGLHWSEELDAWADPSSQSTWAQNVSKWDSEKKSYHAEANQGSVKSAPTSVLQPMRSQRIPAPSSAPASVTSVWAGKGAEFLLPVNYVTVCPKSFSHLLLLGSADHDVTQFLSLVYFRSSKQLVCVENNQSLGAMESNLYK